MIIWLTGNRGAGKTTLANAWRKQEPSWILLDGDEMRSSISRDAGFSRRDRHEHNLRVARLAAELARQDHNVVVAVIAPFAETRREVDQIANVKWVFLRRWSLPIKADEPYEDPKECLMLDVDAMTIEAEVGALTRLVYGKPSEGMGI